MEHLKPAGSFLRSELTHTCPFAFVLQVLDEHKEELKAQERRQESDEGPLAERAAHLERLQVGWHCLFLGVAIRNAEEQWTGSACRWGGMIRFCGWVAIDELGSSGPGAPAGVIYNRRR